MKLSDAFAKVEVTESQAIAILSDLAGSHSDRDRELATALNKAITELSGGKTEEEEDKDEEKPSTSTPSSVTASRTSSVTAKN